jgi:hypothetical protein
MCPATQVTDAGGTGHMGDMTIVTATSSAGASSTATIGAAAATDTSDSRAADPAFRSGRRVVIDPDSDHPAGGLTATIVAATTDAGLPARAIRITEPGHPLHDTIDVAAVCDLIPIHTPITPACTAPPDLDGLSAHRTRTNVWS